MTRFKSNPKLKVATKTASSWKQLHSVFCDFAIWQLTTFVVDTNMVTVTQVVCDVPNLSSPLVATTLHKPLAPVHRFLEPFLYIQNS